MLDMMSFPVSADDRQTVKISPDNRICVFEGWGTGFSRWAVEAANSKETADVASDMLFGDDGLRMNIVRYELSGGDDPTHDHFLDNEKMSPSWIKNVTNRDGSITHKIDPSADSSRLALLKKCADKAAGDLSVELCPTSPPYYMTVSGCTAGAVYSGQDNLLAGSRGAYGTYLASVAAEMISRGVNVRSIAPMNEPSSRYWKAGDTRQEGCHISAGEQQSKLLSAVRSALDKAGLSRILIASSDECDVKTAAASYAALSANAKKITDKINVHSAETADPPFIAAAEKCGKVWITESDGLYNAGSDAGEMSAALGLSKRIIADLQNSGASAWVMWQAVTDKKPDQKNGYLGLLYKDRTTGKIEATQKYYAFGQFSRYINDSSALIRVDDDTIAAWDASSDRLTIVAVNDSSEVRKVRYSTEDFGILKGSTVTEVRTSGSISDGEQWSVTDNAAKLYSSGFDADLAPNSVTSFVINGVLLLTEGTTGDINGDGFINVTDLSLAASHVKSVRCLSDEALLLADVNGDGKVNVSDISHISAHIKGKRAIVKKSRYSEDDLITDVEDTTTSDEEDAI